MVKSSILDLIFHNLVPRVCHLRKMRDPGKEVVFFRPKPLKTYTLWGCTYLYSLYKGVHPPPFSLGDHYRIFYDNCKNSRALVGQFLWSICGQTHEFEIHATRQRTRAGNSTICYRKKQIDVSFKCACRVIDNEFRHHIVKVVSRSTRLSPCGSTATLTMWWRNLWSITGQTHKKLTSIC